MKIRLLSSLALVSILVLAFAGSATARKPIPPITATGPYKVLKQYVNELRSKSNVPVRPSRRSGYKSKLNNKSGNAFRQVNNLFQRRKIRAYGDDLAVYKADSKAAKQSQKRRIAALANGLANRLNNIQADYNNAIDRLNLRFAPSVDPLQRKIKLLVKKLRKTSKPARRAKIQQSINKTDGKLNVVQARKQNFANAILSKFTRKKNFVTAQNKVNVAGVKADTRQAIRGFKRVLTRKNNEQLAAARDRKGNDRELVDNLKQGGQAAIARMPAA